MAVSYADINQLERRKCAFFVGDYGLGYCVDWLELGCDGLGRIHYTTLMQWSQMPVDIQSPRRKPFVYTKTIKIFYGSTWSSVITKTIKVFWNEHNEEVMCRLMDLKMSFRR